MGDEELHDWIDDLSRANPGYSQRIVDKEATEADWFFFNWFLDLSAQWL